MKHELALAKEVAKYFPEKPQERVEVAKILSKAFSTDGKQKSKGEDVEKRWIEYLIVKYTKLQLLSTSLI